MRVLLGVPWYFPTSVGGTEVYVRGLGGQLREAGVDVAIATPSPGRSLQADSHDGVQVFRFPSDGSSDDGELNINRPEPAGWCDLLDTFAPTVVDLHALATSLELRHLKAAQRRGARTVTTLHLPGALCARGTFMRFGSVPCPWRSRTAALHGVPPRGQRRPDRSRPFDRTVAAEHGNPPEHPALADGRPEHLHRQAEGRGAAHLVRSGRQAFGPGRRAVHLACRCVDEQRSPGRENRALPARRGRRKNRARDWTENRRSAARRLRWQIRRGEGLARPH